jgi:membrane-associated phospholipid phosphatase
MRFLTDFGDSAVLLPLSALILVWLLATRRISAALWWAAALAVLGGLLGALKLVFFACPPASDISSPSGHTGFSLVIYGGIATILARRQAAWLRLSIIGVALALVIGIAVSRVALDLHTKPEIVIGLAVGAVALAIFIVGYRRTDGGKNRIGLLLIGMIAIVALFHGTQLNPEADLHEFSGWLGLRQAFCPR